MLKISAVIITFNEEHNIERCLKSVQTVADEIVVLDSFSTDKTEEICKNYHVKFLQHKFDGHIQQKNRVADAAENDYILSLDADEELSAELQKSIQKVKETGNFDAYRFNRLNIYCGKPIKHTTWYPDRKIRLWNRKKGKWGGTNPHDTIILTSGASLKFIKGDLLHYSYNTIEEHIKQANKFSSISAEQINKNNQKNLFLKAFINPSFRFLNNYFLKLGFLEGYTGLVISIIISFETFLKYSKAVYLRKIKK